MTETEWPTVPDILSSPLQKKNTNPYETRLAKITVTEGKTFLKC